MWCRHVKERDCERRRSSNEGVEQGLWDNNREIVKKREEARRKKRQKISVFFPCETFFPFSTLSSFDLQTKNHRGVFERRPLFDKKKERKKETNQSINQSNHANIWSYFWCY